MSVFRVRLGTGHSVDPMPAAGKKSQQLAVDAVNLSAYPGALVLRYGAAHSRPALPAR